MTDPASGEKTLRRAEDDGSAVIGRVARIGVALMLVFAAGGWFLRGQDFALSVLLGGALINISFFLLSRDVRRLMQQVSAEGEAAASSMGIAKMRFVLRSMARFVVLFLLLGALALHMTIDVIGLTLGLTTVAAGVVITGLGARRGRLPNKA
ncbi:MAG: ATP synthase subunit I [Desulfobulbus sp.]|jgi:hypothetical protein